LYTGLKISFCSQCGNATSQITPEGDNKSRAVCQSCEFVDYQNPKIVAGCLVTYADQVLLCKRAIEPRKGFWTLPAGYMEMAESTEDAAIRETYEEACADVSDLALYTLYDLPYISQFYIFYKAELSKPEFGVGVESLEVALFNEEDIPWDQLAFPIVGRTLKYYFADRKEGVFPIRHRTLNFKR
jgi:ADP-ribose pyrophosphatase YjhB (NUDIX family)